MSKWAGKYVIGLTGNIGTGKSVVRRMLEHLGAYGIDADALSHRATAKGAPGYQPVVEAFGKWIVGENGEIDRSRLGRLVFSDPEALHTLENIIHPLVESAVDVIVRHASQKIVVVEAIKLIETNLRSNCDVIWVVAVPPEVQLARLVQNRHMTEDDARTRIASQPSQQIKMSLANQIIRNNGSYEETWRQVTTAWQKTIPSSFISQTTAPVTRVQTPQGELSVERGKPRNSTDIANLINRVNKPKQLLTRDDIMAAFGEKAFLLCQVGGKLVGVVGLQVENLVARTVDIVLDPVIPVQQALPPLINEVERASRDLQCEASLVFSPPELARQEATWKSMGYEMRNPLTLGVMAWQEAARDSMPPNSVLFFKQLRQDRILRPI